MTKTLLAVALTAGLSVASTSAMAVAFPDFQVQEGAVGSGSAANTFTADKITGNYTEIASFGAAAGLAANQFAVSILWNGGQFVANDGTLPVNSQLGSSTAGGATNGYGLYALIQAGGIFATVGGVTTFTFLPGGSLALYLDPLQNTTFTAPTLGTGAWTIAGNLPDDILIGKGGVTSGGGTLDPTLATCLGGGINCGSFGTTTSFALEPPTGPAYFFSPSPFFNVSFQSGQLKNFTPTGTQSINGSLDVVFGTVPEPTSMVLMGLGLVGMGLLRRKQA